MMSKNRQYQQDITQYSIDELIDISEHIDRVRYPERLEMVLKEIQQRQQENKSASQAIPVITPYFHFGTPDIVILVCSLLLLLSSIGFLRTAGFRVGWETTGSLDYVHEFMSHNNDDSVVELSLPLFTFYLVIFGTLRALESVLKTGRGVQLRMTMYWLRVGGFCLAVGLEVFFLLIYKLDGTYCLFCTIVVDKNLPLLVWFVAIVLSIPVLLIALIRRCFLYV